jgi:gluconate kinase
MSFDDARVVLITGIQASGKTTVGRMLAARFRRAAYIEGDVLWQMVVAGRVDMADPPSDEARRQLAQRYRHGAMLAQSFVSAGFVAVHADNIYGPDVLDYLAAVEAPKSLVVLRPSPDAVAQRERTRGTNAYAPWLTEGRSLIDAISQFDEWLSRSPGVGLWVDSSGLTPEQTVDQIVERWNEATVDDGQPRS